MELEIFAMFGIVAITFFIGLFKFGRISYLSLVFLVAVVVFGVYGFWKLSEYVRKENNFFE